MDTNNNRGEAIRKIIALCDLHNFSYEYDENEFRIKLPTVEPLPVTRPSFNRDTQIASTWTLELNPDLKTQEEPLNEGEPPKPSEFEEPDDER